MKKYNLSEIMKRAWATYNTFKKYTFSYCLKNSWAIAKNEAKMAEEKSVEEVQGIVTMHYAEYKKNYTSCKTVNGSYDKSTKTIKVYTKGYVSASRQTTKITSRYNTYSDGRCRCCGTWCYGDCIA